MILVFVIVSLFIVFRFKKKEHDRAGEESAVREALSEKLQQWVDRNLAGERTDPICATDGAWTCYTDDKGKR